MTMFLSGWPSWLDSLLGYPWTGGDLSAFIYLLLNGLRNVFSGFAERRSISIPTYINRIRVMTHDT